MPLSDDTAMTPVWCRHCRREVWQDGNLWTHRDGPWCPGRLTSAAPFYPADATADRLPEEVRPQWTLECQPW